MLVVAGVAKSHPFFLFSTTDDSFPAADDDDKTDSVSPDPSCCESSTLRIFPEAPAVVEDEERLGVAGSEPATATGGSVAAMGMEVVSFAASAAFLFLVRGGVVKGCYVYRSSDSRPMLTRSEC